MAALASVGPVLDRGANRAQWERWQEGLREKFTLREALPPLRMLLIGDTLAGHQTPEMVCWLMRHGILPLSTPLGGSWLNMAESSLSTWRNQASGFWCNAPCPDSIHRTRLRSSPGAKRPHADGIGRRGRLCGVGHVMRGGSVPGSGGVSPTQRCMRWVVREPVLLRSFRMPERHEVNGYKHTG